MASVEVESATNTLPEKVEVPKEVEAVVATPPAPEPEVEESTKATIEPLNADAPPPVEDPPTVQDPVEIESKGVDEPKTDEEQVKADTTQEEVKETAEAVIEETTTTVTEEAEKPVEEDQTPTEVVVNTEVAKEE
ncbi:hypothetical protein HanHA300_Chr01g0006221 [Helianthus annuus]|nr:hypothetical protein HanHA300_Chr01g0006221 [Helianthus annuus]KAJ0625906.1 hypothetical protein HanHA89_Chr01g0006881 [Helianthus annuus]KAJ0803959.1 hypothetical protein HanLR1_Chr00c1565g0809741 [Helianthus annuus]